MADTQKKIHKHLHSITRINTVLSMLGLAAVVVLFMWLKWFAPSEEPEYPIEDIDVVIPGNPDMIPIDGTEEVMDAVDTVALGEEYRSSINALIGDFAFDDAGKAGELVSSVLELRVPAELKNMHLQIVLALNEAQEGKFTEAVERIETMQGQFGWVETGL